MGEENKLTADQLVFGLRGRRVIKVSSGFSYAREIPGMRSVPISMHKTRTVLRGRGRGRPRIIKLRKGKTCKEEINMLIIYTSKYLPQEALQKGRTQLTS
jgi:hypothetical protein